MNLSLITPYPPLPGGLSSFSKRLVEQLSTSGDLKVSVIPFNSFLDINNVIKLGKDSPDFVRVEYNIPAYGLATLPLFIIILYYRLFTKTRFVVNFHEVSREVGMLGIFGQVFYFIFSIVFNHIYTHTEEAKSILIRKCLVKSTKVSVIALGTSSTVQGDNQNKEFLKSLRIDNRKIILSFGFIHPDKGIEYLLLALADIKKNHPKVYMEVQVVIAGGIRKRSGVFKFFEKKDENYRSKLISMVAELKILDSVIFINYVKSHLITSLFKNSYIAVLPYTKVEQSGVLNMLLPTGIPIVASNIGGLKETLEGVGVLVNPADPKMIAKEIVKLVNDSSYYDEVKSSYLVLSRKLNISKIVQDFLKSLKEI